MQSFRRRFGEFNDQTDKYSLPGWSLSIMAPTPFLGLHLLCLDRREMGPSCRYHSAMRNGDLARVPHLVPITLTRPTMIPLYSEATLTSTSTAASHFKPPLYTGPCSRSVAAIVVIPIYQADTAPGSPRGMFASTIELKIALSTLIASVVILGTKPIDGNAVWLIPIGLQLPIPAIILTFFPAPA
ncbi:hypothetical protein GCG54_00015361 [Colletotrichum gloeosporioides]|uniref:Uncharacterized protein n=1 Tax=Colletotrichum gloeosporioides TaxID=474922 RepID=A0A8H4FP25_COLGL|nr:uncharacterized protein GCG54_00015361 [Colletotrichum gloeosporioides]KAF3807979.1 hypothetical protein GCG54_00015361 [Colletotrichum gloeosporioides]